MVDGLEVSYEWDYDSDPKQLFVHLTVTDGNIFGKCRWVRDNIPLGAWITVPPSLQPTITKVLERYCGFEIVATLPIDGEMNDVLRKIRM